MAFAADDLPSSDRHPLASALHRIRRDPLALAAPALNLLHLLAAILAPLVAPFAPPRVEPRIRLSPPGPPGHVLGTDELGRDELSRIIWGGRISLFVGFAPVVMSSVIGVGLGLIAGYSGRRVDIVITRSLD